MPDEKMAGERHDCSSSRSAHGGSVTAPGSLADDKHGANKPEETIARASDVRKGVARQNVRLQATRATGTQSPRAVTMVT